MFGKSLNRLVGMLGLMAAMHAGCLRAYNEYAYEISPWFCCGDAGDFEFTVDWLYWRPCPDGIYAALKGVNITNLDFTFDELNFKVDNFDFSLDSGVRVGFIYANPCCMNWQVSLKYIYFSPSDSRSVTADPFEFPSATDTLTEIGLTLPIRCFGLGAQPFQFFPPDIVNNKVSAKWELDLHVVDLDTACPFCLCQCLMVEPHLGLRFASIDQHLRTKEEGQRIIDSEEEVFQDVDRRDSYRNEFCGVGPRIGVGLSWEYGCGFGIFGSLSTSYLYGERCANFSENVINSAVTAERFETPESEFISKDRDDSCCSRIVGDAALGLYWETCFCNCYDVNLHLAWEHHAFYNQSVLDGTAICLVLSNEEDSTLTTQGLTFGATIGF